MVPVRGAHRRAGPSTRVAGDCKAGKQGPPAAKGLAPFGMALRLAAGALAFDRKRYPEAEKLFQQSLAILSCRFPAPQIEIGRVTANLAEVYVREKRFPEAASAFDQALAILERTLGPDNAELVPTMEHYSQVLRAQQDFAKAASLEARAMKIRVTRTLKRAA